MDGGKEGGREGGTEGRRAGGTEGRKDEGKEGGGEGSESGALMAGQVDHPKWTTAVHSGRAPEFERLVRVHHLVVDPVYCVCRHSITPSSRCHISRT